MANIIIGSEFKPFSYEEMLAPIMLALQAHQLIEDAYSELETKASIWDKMASEENDPIAHNTYKLYARDLLYQANSLAQNGLTPGARKKMLSLKSRYASDITPIELAYARRKELQDELRKALLQNPTLMFERDLNNIGYESSLDRFIENPLYDYGQSYSGALLTLQVATKAAALAKELRDPGENGQIARKQLEQILPYQYRLLEQKGFNSNEVLNAILQDPNASLILTNLVDSTLASSGIANWADLATMNKARAYANEGLWNAVGQSEYKYLTDLAGLTTLQYDLADRNAKRVEDRKRKEEEDRKRKEEEDKSSNLSLRSTALLQISGKEREYLNTISKLTNPDGKVYVSYFGKTGKVNPLQIREMADDYIKNNGGKRFVLAQNAARWFGGQKVTGFREGHGPSAEELIKIFKKILKEKLYSGPFEDLDLADDAMDYLFLEEYNRTASNDNKVSEVLSKQDAEALTTLGYSKDKDFNISTFSLDARLSLDRVSKQNYMYSTSMPDYSYINDVISGNLAWMDKNGQTAGKIYKLEKDGSAGKPVNYGDLNLKDNKITDIEYSPNAMDKIIITVNGDKYAVSPEVISSDVSNLILEATKLYQLYGDTYKQNITYDTVSQLISFMDNYNQLRSKTSSTIL